MNDVTLIFPHQLFEHNPAVSAGRPVVIVEDFLFFKVQPFHRQRLILLRAAMRAYADYLRAKGFKVSYVDSMHSTARGEALDHIAKQGLKNVHVIDVVDEWLQQDLEKAARRFGWTLHWYDSPCFLNTKKENQEIFKAKKRFSHVHFYTYQRRKENILMEDGFPVGGKLSYDVENRKRLAKGVKIPERVKPRANAYVEEAVAYVAREFPEAIGCSEPFSYAITFEEAEEALKDFVAHRLAQFGPYEDAISSKEPVIFHSVLSPFLNIGLITPRQVIDAVLKHASKHEIPLPSLEGFVRQVIGWREYVRACYALGGSYERTFNVFKHKRKLPKGFWDGTTGIDPVDATIKKLLATGYCHHIERLMILGNFLLLTETDPDDVYEWFMAYFIDSYDWVMVPNVYGMSQFADAGFMTTKPYVSSSNYIIKMSDYKKGEWSEVWDGLFWRFMAKHEKLFSTNPRTMMLLKMLKNKADSLQPKIDKAERWLRR